MAKGNELLNWRKSFVNGGLNQWLCIVGGSFTIVCFTGFEEKAVSSPQAVLCNAILLCGFYTRCLLHGKPINPLRAPTWKYLTYMLESRKQLFLKHCFQLVCNILFLVLFSFFNRNRKQAVHALLSASYEAGIWICESVCMEGKLAWGFSGTRSLIPFSQLWSSGIA